MSTMSCAIETSFPIEALRCSSKHVERLVGGDVRLGHEDAFGLAYDITAAQRLWNCTSSWAAEKATAAWAANSTAAARSS